jgi:hypothetical protein
MKHLYRTTELLRKHQKATILGVFLVMFIFLGINEVKATFVPDPSWATGVADYDIYAGATAADDAAESWGVGAVVCSATLTDDYASTVSCNSGTINANQKYRVQVILDNASTKADHAMQGSGDYVRHRYVVGASYWAGTAASVGNCGFYDVDTDDNGTPVCTTANSTSDYVDMYNSASAGNEVVIVQSTPGSEGFWYVITTASTTNTTSDSYWYAAIDGEVEDSIKLTMTAATRTYEQSAFRWYGNLNGTSPDMPLDSTNSRATTTSDSEEIRLRMLMHIGGNGLAASTEDYTLMFADKGAGTCASPSGSSYATVTAATAIAFKDNAGPSDGAALSATTTDPTHSSDVIVDQTYEEANTFTNTGFISAGEDGLWDFSLVDNTATAGNNYCFKIVKTAGGTDLNTYTVYPEISIYDYTPPNPTWITGGADFKIYAGATAADDAVLTWGNGTAVCSATLTDTNGSTVSCDSGSINANQTYRVQMLIANAGSWSTVLAMQGATEFVDHYYVKGSNYWAGDTPTLGTCEFNDSDSDNTGSPTCSLAWNATSNVRITNTAGGTNVNIGDGALGGNDNEGIMYLITTASSTNTSSAGYLDTAVDTYTEDSSKITITGSSRVYTQSGYRFFDNIASTSPGSTLGTSNTKSYLTSTGQAFRLRLLLHVEDNGLAPDGEDFTLLFGENTSTCAAATYATVTASTLIKFSDNAGVADGDALGATTTDPIHGTDVIVNQTYEEANNFTSTSTISAGEDGKWDFSLKDNGATASTTYCFKVVRYTGAADLDTYTFYPEVTTMTIPTISSAADQNFASNQATTSISAITITAGADNQITTANDIRITIATTTVDMRWDHFDDTANITGATSRVSTSVTYEDNNATLVINVTDNFNKGESITISELSFAKFTTDNLAATGLYLYTDGATDTGYDAVDDKSIAISFIGRMTVSNYSGGQVTNNFSSDYTSTTTNWFKFNINQNEVATGTMSLSLGNVNGLSANDFKLNVFPKTNSNGGPEISFGGTANSFLGGEDDYDIGAFGYDSANKVVYVARNPNLSGGNDAYYCVPDSDGDADGLCEPDEWTISWDTANANWTYEIYFDQINEVMYMIEGRSVGDAYIWYCEPGADGDSDGICEDGEWTLSVYRSLYEDVFDIVLDSTNETLYAAYGRNWADNEYGDIYYCQPSIDGNEDGVCTSTEWTISFDGVQENMENIIFDATNETLYATQGYESGDGDMYYCQPSIDGDKDGICEDGEWNLGFDGAGSYLMALEMDTDNEILYLSVPNGVDTDIYYCRPSLDYNMDGVCGDGEWTNTQTIDKYAERLYYEPFTQTMYALIYYSSGSNAAIFRCQPGVDGDADDICENGEWKKVFARSTEAFQEILYEPDNKYLYAGVGWGAYEGDIYACHVTSMCATTTDWYSPNIAYDSALTIATIKYEPDSGVIYTGEYGSAGQGDAYYCITDTSGDGDGICEDGEWTISYDGSQEAVYAFGYDSINKVMYLGEGVSNGDADTYYCQTDVDGDGDGICEDGEWTLSDDAGILYQYVSAFMFDVDNEVMYKGMGYNSVGSGDIFYCASSSGDTNGICEPGEWATSSDFSYRTIESFTYDPGNGTIYAGIGRVANEGRITHCRPLVDGDGDGICEPGEWTEEYIIPGNYTHDVAFDSKNGYLYVGIGADNPYIYVCNPNTDGDTDEICEVGEFISIDFVSSGITTFRSMTYDPVLGFLYATTGAVASMGNIFCCHPNEYGDQNGVCDSLSEWHLCYDPDTTSEINSVEIDTSSGLPYSINITDIIYASEVWPVTPTIGGSNGSITISSPVVENKYDYINNDYVLYGKISGLGECSQMTISLPDSNLDVMGTYTNDTFNITNTLSSIQHYIGGTLTTGNHSVLGQVVDAWSTESSTTTIHYRYNVTPPEGITLNLGTTTIDLSAIAGVNTGDITGVKLYYDGNSDGTVNSSTTDWSVLNTATGTFDTTSSIDGVDSMANINGTLYIGTSKTGEAEVYRYDGSVDAWTVLNTTAGTFDTTSSIGGVYGIANINGTLYIGTSKVSEAEVYRYDGSVDAWTALNTTAGTFDTTLAISTVYSMADVNGTLYVGTYMFNNAEVYRYDGSVDAWTALNTTAGTFDTTSAIYTVYSMANINGTLYIGTNKPNEAEVYRYDNAVDSWTALNTTAGTFDTTSAISTVYSMTNINDTLYIGTNKPNGAEVYRYDNAVDSWTALNTTAGTFDTTSSIDIVYGIANINGTLYIGTGKAGGAEVYRYNYDQPISGLDLIPGTTGTLTFATSTTYSISTTTDFLIELTASNLESAGGGGASTPPLKLTGSGKLKGLLKFIGRGGSGGGGGDPDTMTVDYSSIETDSCQITTTGNPSPVTHSK